MRIESVAIDGCGIFHNATLEQLPEGLTVVPVELAPGDCSV